MPPHRKPLLASIVAALLLLAAPPAIREACAQEASWPSRVEQEFWTSAQQIGTAAAYQAYLNRFPEGFFAPLAAAAIRKGGGAASAPSPQPPKLTEVRARPAAKPGGAPFAPARIAGPTNSSAITQQVGDVYHGPGPITVGWLGAKKQIVVPAGDWVLLAAEDSLSTHSSPVSLTSLVLARVEGSLVRSLLLARFNSKIGNPHYSWGDADFCKARPRPSLFAWHEPGFWVTQCVKSVLLPQENATKTFSASIWNGAFNSLAAGGGRLPDSAYLVTDLFYTGDASNYMKISRIDFDVSPEESAEGSAPGVHAALPDLSRAAREKWARAYTALAAVGYRKKLAEEELYADSPATISPALLPD